MWKTLPMFDEIMTSETNRTKRHDFDFYPTRQIEPVRAALRSILPPDFAPKTILDPACGTGVWAECARELYPNALIVGLDINPAMTKPPYVDIWVTADYRFADVLQYAPNGFDLIATNPPYGILEQGKEKATPIVESQIRKGYKELAQGGYLTFLLAQGFVSTVTRVSGLFREIPLVAVKTYDKRISFFDATDKKTGKKKKNSTDQINYIQILVQQGYKGTLDNLGVPTYTGGFIQWGS